MHNKTTGATRCSECGITSKACLVNGGNGPDRCPTLHMGETIKTAGEWYSRADVHEFARQASIQEAECYIHRDRKPQVLHPVKPRLQEICEFAQKMGYKKIGLAFCIGLQTESRAVSKVLEEYGFETFSVVCKVGGIPKEEIGITDDQKISIGEHETMCNPIAQAEALNEQNTEFNVLLGLCVGHDSLFFKRSVAPTTVLAVKDRVTGHNPLAIIYTLGTYSQRFVKKNAGR